MTGEMVGAVIEPRLAGGPGEPGEPRVLPAASVRGLPAHFDRYGAVRLRGEALIREVEGAGLTGRGGAAFPTGKKLRAVRERAGLRGAVVIANGMESEPASAKDAALLARTPHLVLDGIAIAADAVSARSAYLCVRRPAQADALAEAVAERADMDLVPVTVVLVPERYVSSAESALVRYVNGGPALPGFGSPRPFERGVRGRPTLVSNVESLANVALIARYGAGWYRRAGTASAPGSALVTVSGAVHDPGVYEIALGTPIGSVLAMAGGAAGRGQSRGVQAVLTGGYFGTWLPGDVALRTPASPHDLRTAGGSFGAGIFLVLPDGGCGLAETARVVRYLAAHSAGQCGPCLHGLPEIAAAFDRVAFGDGQGGPAGWGVHAQSLRWLQDLFGLVEGRGACQLPDGVARLAASALRVFAGDVRRHERGPCAGAGRRSVFSVPEVR